MPFDVLHLIRKPSSLENLASYHPLDALKSALVTVAINRVSISAAVMLKVDARSEAE